MANGRRVEYSIVNLHEDKDAFAELVERTAQDIGLPQVYIEKDYWVTKALKNLSTFAQAERVVFKGGTSLSKAYKLIQRFSEDIDLAVFAQEEADAPRKRLLKGVEQSTAQGLEVVNDDPRISKGSRYRCNVQ